jgi:hypothetical protein
MSRAVPFSTEDVKEARFWEEGATLGGHVTGEDSATASEDILWVLLSDGIDRPPIRGPLARWLADELATKGVRVQWHLTKK